MVIVANDRGNLMRDLPSPSDYGLPVRDVLTVPSLRGTQVLAGAAGLGRIVRRLNVMEVPDILPWVKPNELLLTTGFPLRHVQPTDPKGANHDAVSLVELVTEFNARELAGVAIKLGRYLDDVPKPVLDQADKLGFPLLRLPDGVAFDDILTDAFGELIDRQSRALSQTDELHRTLATIVLEGGELPQIAEEVARLLHAAVLISTPDGRVQAEGGQPEARASLHQLPLFDPTGRFRCEQTKHGIQRVGHGWLAMVSIIAGGVDHGRIAAFRQSGPLPAAALQALERTATVAALAITKNLAVSAVEDKFRGDFLRDVLGGEAGTTDEVVEHCASLGWEVNRPMVVVVAELDPEATGRNFAPPSVPLRAAQDRFAYAWQQVIRGVDRTAPVVGFAQEVVTLLPVHTSPDGDQQQTRVAVSKAVDEVVTAVAGDRGGGRRSFCAGVSRLIVGPDDIPDGYAQARKAVAVGRRVRGRGSVSHFDSLGVHRLLSLVTDTAELRAFAAEVLGDLAGEGSEAADLRRTLQTLLDTNLNVAETARLLHFHYNTLRYRIGKLERIVGPFSTDPHLRLDVALALQVMEMRGI